MEPQPPGYAYKIGFNDFLQVDHYNREATVAMNVYIRTMLPDGTIQVHQYALAVTTSGDMVRQNIRIDSGWLIGVSFSCTSLGVLYGLTYVTARLIYGSAAAPTGYQTLVSGYVIDGMQQSWPDVRPINPMESFGGFRTLQGTSPAAGANFTLSMGTSEYVNSHSLVFRVVTDANVANRRVSLLYDDSGTPASWTIQCATTQAASLTYDYCFSPMPALEVLTNNVVSVPMPVIPMVPLSRMRVVIASIQATDQISAIRHLQGIRYSPAAA